MKQSFSYYVGGGTFTFIILMRVFFRSMFGGNFSFRLWLFFALVAAVVLAAIYYFVTSWFIETKNAKKTRELDPYKHYQDYKPMPNIYEGEEPRSFNTPPGISTSEPNKDHCKSSSGNDPDEPVTTTSFYRK